MASSRCDSGGGSLIGLLIWTIGRVVSLCVTLWVNGWLATGSLLLRGRMPSRFYSASSLAAKVRSLLYGLWRRAGVLVCALLVGAFCVVRFVLRRLLRPGITGRAVAVPKPLRGAPNLKWLEHSTVKIHGVKLHYVSAGIPTRRLVLLVHGFPEFWYCWKHQLRELSRSEWVVALDLPGYGDSDSPLRRSQYSVNALVPLIQQFVSSLGRQECVLIGSNAGALLGWHLVMRAPETFIKFVSISQPLPHIAIDILEGSIHWKLKHWRRYLYQLPWLPELLIASGDLDILSTEYGHLQYSGRVTAEDLRALQFAFSRPEDWRGPLMHQRQWFDVVNSSPPEERIGVPTLQVFGRRDGSLPLDSMYRSLAHLRDTNIEVVEDAGHRPHLERPEETNRIISDFIGMVETEEEVELDAPVKNRSIAWKALEGGYGLIGVGSSLVNKTIDKMNTASALGELYAKSVLLLND